MPHVSIVIPTKDKVNFLKECIDSIREKTEGIDYELVIVDHSSVEKPTLDYFASIQAQGKCTIIKAPKESNFSKLCNLGAKSAQGTFLLFLNNDTKVTIDWLQEMLNCYKKYSFGEKVGCVGAKLLFPDGRIQHIGQMLRYNDQVPTHLYYGKSPLEPHVQEAVKKTRRVVGVTAACMLVRKNIFDSVNGFDEEYDFGFEDVDFCFKLKDKGYTHFYCHTALIYHQEHGTLSVSPERDNKNIQLLFKKWQKTDKLKRVGQI